MIHGQQVGLRAIEWNDLNTLLYWRNKPEFRQYFRETRELNGGQQEYWFESTVLKESSARMFAIQNKNTPDLLGACGLCGIDWVNGSAEISIYIGDNDAYLDDQYAPDALQVLTHHAFYDLRLHRLWAEVYSFDDLKNQLFSRAGFTRVGEHPHTRWHQGQWHNSFYYSKLSPV